jgi:hypothetical protein
LYVLFSLVIVLSVIRFITSDCSFGIFYLIGFSSYSDNKWRVEKCLVYKAMPF